MAPPTTAASDGDQQPNIDEATNSHAARRLNRKRTKTGCLTCRRRRMCTPCHPGYNQRVIFKPPAFDYPPMPNGSGHITFQAGPVPGPAVVFQHPLTRFARDQASYTQLPPQALEQFVPGYVHEESAQPPYQPQLAQASLQQLPPPPDCKDSMTTIMTAFPSVSHADCAMMLPYALPAAFKGHSLAGLDACQDRSMADGNQNNQVPGNGESPVSVFWKDGVRSLPESATWASETSGETFSKASPASASTVHGVSNLVPEDLNPTNSMREQFLRLEFSRSISSQVKPLETADVQKTMSITPEYCDHGLHPNSSRNPTFLLTEAAVQVCDDDYYDVASDDEMEPEYCTIVTSNEDHHNVLTQIMEHSHISAQDLNPRRYDTFAQNGMLDRYNLEWVANPLKNTATARIFAHFINVTGPSLSMFERQPRSSSALFMHGHIPLSQRGLWTYTMPMVALHSQGLLHAMLAIASLHIARLTGASATPSLQHYVWATKRVHADVGHPKKRLQGATIGASMLLGFYEVMTADHIRWNTHLAGSSKLFIETEFAEMTRQSKRMRRQRDNRTSSYNESSSKQQTEDEVLEQIFDVDERIISDFVGKEVRYEDHGRIMEGQTCREKPLDLTKFETVKDLYWWYCKQDVYQAILSGDGLLWGNCPPRAPLGRPDAVYGSFDHLVILLARIANFTAKDRARKLQQIRANGGRWMPAHEVNLHRQQQQARSPTHFSVNGLHANLIPQSPSGAPLSSTGASFYGMTPPLRGNVRPPPSYGGFESTQVPLNVDERISDDLSDATRSALEEYGRIRAALHTFAVNLGDYYKPLEEEHQIPQNTPFGPAKFYRAYDISCLWAIWNMAVIIAIRSHPHMPPAAHVAAAVAKRETAPFADEIGRIVTGIVPGPADEALHPNLTAALCESCMPSFFAAVQYEDAERRRSTVLRLHAIARRTGWGSAELIANGCETAWVKGAARGGPPYVRVVRQQSSDDPRLNGSWEHLNPTQMPKDGDQGDRRLVHRRTDARINWAIGVMGTEDDVTMIG
nr:hypothetical protein CFP56_41413 [Quercus suber]